MRNEFLKNGYYYNFFGDLMQLMHRILEKQDNEALDALYHMTGGFYHKYPQPYTSAVLLAIDHELVRHEGFPAGQCLDIPHLSGDQAVHIEIQPGISLSREVFQAPAF